MVLIVILKDMGRIFSVFYNYFMYIQMNITARIKMRFSIKSISVFIDVCIENLAYTNTWDRRNFC